MQRSHCTHVFSPLGALLLISVLCGAGTSRAAVFLGGGEVVVGVDQVIEDDVIASGGSIRIDGVVRGDLVAAGGAIIVNGSVESNLIAAAGQITLRGSVGADVMASGGTLLIDGEVGDDVRMSGYALQLGSNAKVGDDLFAGGFSLDARPKSRVNGSVFFGGYQARMAGRVGENLNVGVGALEIQGTVTGDVSAGVGQAGEQRPPDVISYFFKPSVEVPNVPSGFTVGESARIGGDLRYGSRDAATIDAGAKIAGSVQFEEREDEFRFPSIRSHVRRFATLLVIGLALLWLAPGWSARLSRMAQDRPLPSLAWGAALTVSVLIAAVLVGVLTALAVGIFGGLTLGGLAPPFLGIGLLLELALLTPFLIVALYLPPILMGNIAGRWALGRYRPDWLRFAAAPLAIGLVLYAVARALPLLGGLVFLGTALVGLGAAAIWVRDLLRNEPAEASGPRGTAPGQSQH